ncbi:hypothetical protein [Halorussus halophilus]|uniref:hypothetical protein n=1 Tax=Halorussus halophilus TaxID=2650975 RepID=UPI0013011C2B|nr:hypothetical protein [Halorussus halophilus]
MSEFSDEDTHSDDDKYSDDDTLDGQEQYDRTEADEPIAKIYYADEEATQVDAAFVIEDWDWVVGFNQIATDEYDYVSIPVEKVIGVMSPQYASFSQNGRRITGYGVTDEELSSFADLLPV